MAYGIFWRLGFSQPSFTMSRGPRDLPPSPSRLRWGYKEASRGTLRLSSYSAHPGHLTVACEGGELRPPARQRHYSGFYRLQAGEESGDLLWAAGMVGAGRVLVVVAYGLVECLAGADAIAEGEIAARWHGIQQALDDRLRVVGVGDLAGVAQVGVDVVAGALGRAGEQGAGVHQHERIVVDVDDARFRGDRLGDLVGVVGGRQAGADVQELADPRLAGQVPDRAAQERPVSAGEAGDVREHRHDLVTDHAVGRVMVLAAQPVIPDPGRVRHGYVELRRVLAGGGRIVGHGSRLQFVL